MFLSADEITAEVQDGALVIKPFDRCHLKRASYVLSLGDVVRSWAPDESPLDVWSPGSGSSGLGPPMRVGQIILRQQSFLLGVTGERLSVPTHLVGFLSTMSHLARFGISVHSASYLVSPGFGSVHPLPITLELASMNPRPLLLRTGMPICHLLLARVTATQRTDHLSTSIYEGRDAPCPPLLYEELASLFPDVVADIGNA